MNPWPIYPEHLIGCYLSNLLINKLIMDNYLLDNFCEYFFI